MYKCPKCGFDNTDEAKFCAGCGSKIEKVKFCPKCGKEVKQGQMFCSECGTRLIEATSAPETPKEAPVSEAVVATPAAEKVSSTPVQKVSKARIMTIIAEAFAILFVVMAMISIWGDFVTLTTKVGNDIETTSLGVKYWFEDGWKIMEQTADSVKATKVFFIFGFISFLAAIGGVFGAGITAIVQCSKGISQAKNANFKGARAVGITAMFAMFYFFFTFLTQCAYMKMDSVSLTSTFGWGGIMFVVFLAIAIAASLVRKIVLNENNKYKGSLAIAREAIVFVAIIVFVLVGFNVMSGIKQDNQVIGYSSLTFIQVLGAYWGQSEFPTIAFIMGIISTVCVIGAISMACFVIYALFVENVMVSKEKVRNLLIPLAVSFILAFVFSLISTENYLAFLKAPIDQVKTVPTVYSIIGLVVSIGGTVAYCICDYLSAKK